MVLIILAIIGSALLWLFSRNPVAIVLVTVIAAVYYFHLRYRTTYFHRIGLPSPPIGSLFLGHLRQKQQDKKEHLQLLKWEHELDSKTYGVYEGAHRVIVSSDLDLLNDVFVKQFDNFHSRKIGAHFANNQRKRAPNMFVAEGGRWKRLRMIIAPIFVTAKMRKMEMIVMDSIQVLMDVLKRKMTAQSPDQVVDIKPVVGELTMDVMERLTLGKPKSTIGTGEKNPYLELLMRLFNPEPIVDSSVHCFFAGTYDFLPVTQYLFLLYATVSSILPFLKLRRSVKKIIDERRVVPSGNKQREDFIDLLLNAEADPAESKQMDAANVADHLSGLQIQKKLTANEIPGLCTMFLIAGFDTTATATIAFAYRLACNPEVQDRLMEEIDANISCDVSTVVVSIVGHCIRGTLQDDINFDVLQKMTYLDWCTREALRVDPLVHSVIARRCVRRTVVANGRYTIDAGVCVQANTWSIHYDKQLWGEDADLYRPERWDPVESVNRHPLAWLPFGLGPRQCVGMRFALLELKMTIVALLRQFRFSKTSDTEFDVSGLIALSPQSMKLRLDDRHRQPN